MTATSSYNEATKDAKALGNDTMSAISTAVRDGATATSDMTKVQAEKLEGMIRANPIAATGIAAGLGFMVALLARRS